MIYVLGFTKKIGNTSKAHGTAQTYCGYCEDGRLNERLAEHRAGRGAAITRAVIEQGGDFNVLLTLPGDRKTERAIKNRKNIKRLLREYGVTL